MRLRILNDWRHRSWNDKRFGKIDFICTAQEILTVLNGFQYIHHIKSIIINYKGLILKCLIKFLELRQLANERSQNWTRIVAYQNGVKEPLIYCISTAICTYKCNALLCMHGLCKMSQFCFFCSCPNTRLTVFL